MRILRGVVLIIALVAIAVGISQLFMPKFWLVATEAIVRSSWMPRLFGLLAVLFGGVILAAAIMRAVAFQWFFWALGIWAAGFGIVMLISPALTKELLYAVFLNKSAGGRQIVLLTGGLIRIAIGTILLIALGKSRNTIET